MKNNNPLVNFFAMYVEGFRTLSAWGKALWIIIFIKLFVMFFVLKLFFFPNFLNSKCETTEEKSDFVSTELTNRKQ